MINSKRIYYIIFFFITVLTVLIISHLKQIQISKMLCRTNISYESNDQMLSIKSNLKITFAMNRDNTGSFDIYGYKDSSNGNAKKISRRINFSYKKINDLYYIKTNDIDKFNKDDIKNEDLPEKLSSKNIIISIKKINNADYILYDQVSPIYICRAIN